MTKKILICDDEKEIRDLLKTVLAKDKYELEMAVDGQEAMDKTLKAKPDLILLDISMPKVNGLEVAEQIRKTNATVKIVFLTGYQSQELTKEAAKYNISDYLVKTASTGEVRKAIRDALLA